MDTYRALAGLSALAQESRLKVFRLLIQRGPKGMAAGDIARQLKFPHNTVFPSRHPFPLEPCEVAQGEPLNHLLGRSRRDARASVLSG